MGRPMKYFEHQLGAIADLLTTTSVHRDLQISGLSHSSKEIEPGDLFLAFPGINTHGAHYFAEALGNGAIAVLTDSAGAHIVGELSPSFPTLTVNNPRKSAGVLAAWFYQEPMRDMFSVGITGTNGKTTTTTLLHQIWSAAGRESGLIGTVETCIGAECMKSKRTTPESSDLQALTAIMRERHVQNLAIEVSSHALKLERVRGAHFSAVGFSNLSQDHLDFHINMEEYFSAKASLFTFEYAELGFINIDDNFGERLATISEIPLRRLSRVDSRADWSYVSARSHLAGNDIIIRGPGGILIEGLLPLHGEFNLDNALMAIAIACESGVDPIEIATILPTLTGAQGRLEPVVLGQSFGAFVDYAHSPDAVSRVLAACRGMTEGKVIAVLGCGGDRDSAKRPLMGEALKGGSDVAVFTSDNPRSEDPEEILNQMVGKLKISSPSQVISDRRSAINYAVGQAVSGDVVVILGKGHETGQETLDVITPFDDRKVLAEAIEARR